MELGPEENLDGFSEQLSLQEFEDDDVHSVELRALGVATCVASPAGCCGCFWTILAAMIGFAVYIVFFPICLSFNFSDFKVINSDISNNYYQKILADDTKFSSLDTIAATRRRRRMLENEKYLWDDDNDHRRLQTETLYGYTLWSSTDFYYRAIAAIYLNVFYYSKKTNNILTKELLNICHATEQGIKNFDGYAEHSTIYKETDPKIELLFPDVSPLYLESAPGSFLNYIYPQVILGNYVFNGNGDTLTLEGDDIEETIRTYKDVGDLTEFFDFSFDFVNVSSKYLAAVYPFGYTDEHETKDELYNWVSSYKSLFFDKLGTAVTNNIGIAFSDSRGVILEDELYYYLGQDLNLAILSLLLIYIVVYIYCRSFYITTLGLVGVCCSFIPCFAIYEMVWGESFNLVNMVALWVILGIGCDDICVFISSYRRAPLESVNGQIIPNHLRLAFAYREAGSAMFVTSLTTACSFFSLCLSSINPLPQFGWFLGSLVICNFILVMSWFPCILQSYVWFVMCCMKFKCHVACCNRWLAVAVPLPEQYDHKQDMKAMGRQQSVKVLKRSSNNNNNSSININNNNNIAAASPDSVTKPSYGRQSSNKFIIPGAALQSGDSIIDANNNNNNNKHSAAPAQLVRQLTRKLDSGGLAAETHFSDCTNLYFVVMKRGLGVTLIVLVLLLTCVFAYTATLITLPQETAKLLPESTNWGAVTTAVSQMDIDESKFSGYSTSSGDSTGSIVAVTTAKPTPSPTTPIPSPAPSLPSQSPTLRPSSAPTTPIPTATPSLQTIQPSVSPTRSPTSRPSLNPTLSPVNNPTQSPITLSPSKSPTKSPTQSPTAQTNQPSNTPSKSPSKAPSAPPPPTATKNPTQSPTSVTNQPSSSPTSTTTNPSVTPTTNPSVTPSSQPSSSPTSPSSQPSTSPTKSPVTISPTRSPSNQPSTSPTLQPSQSPSKTPSQSPSIPPTQATLQPSQSPSKTPTQSPTYAIPVNPSFKCVNQDSLKHQIKTGKGLQCTLGTLDDSAITNVFQNSLQDDAGDDTYLEPEQIAFVFEGGGLYGSNDITGCNIANDQSPFYDETAYVSLGEYDVKWCFDSISSTSTSTSTNAVGVNTLNLDIIAPFSLPTPAWFRISVWLYFNSTWNQIVNEDKNAWYNYSIVSEYVSAAEVLSVDESLAIFLVFGTSQVSEFVTDCDGEVTSGTLAFDHRFNIYDPMAQTRWLDLCMQLNTIQDPVMYRTDDDQQLCFSGRFQEYLNNSNSGYGTLPMIDTNKTLFNTYISQYVQTRSSSSFSTHTYDPRDFNGWFGTKQNQIWFNHNASIAFVTQTVRTQINKNWGGATMYEYYKDWQDFMDEFNHNSPSSFQGMQTSSGYIRMEVEVAFLDGFVKSVLYTIILCAIVMIFFTQNLYLVLLVCFYILIICVWVVGLFGAVGWPFGIIEIISVPTVVGLTIDYALHITHAYIHSPFPDRVRRAKSAVNDLGSSVFASAMTTISSMLVLYFATIIIFSDLGWVVGSTTSFGVALALFVCPPCLMFTGPQYDQCHFTWFCPHSVNGIKCGKRTFCSNPWHGKQNKNKKAMPIEHNKAIELEKQQAPQQEPQQQEPQQEGNNDLVAPGSYKHNNNNNIINNDTDNDDDDDDDDDDNIDDDDLPSEWKAVLTDDGKIYYQNDITFETQWTKPVAIAPQTQTKNAIPFTTSPKQSEAEPASYNTNNTNNTNKEAYVIQSALPMQTNAGMEENAATPLVTKGIDMDELISNENNQNSNNNNNDSDNKTYDKIMAEQAKLMEEIEQQKENEPNILLDDDNKNEDNEEEYVPAAPAAPASPEEIMSNQNLMEQAWKTPAGDTINDQDNNDEAQAEAEVDVELEISVSLEYSAQDINMSV